MKEYDVIIAGGGIAGSVAAKFAAKGGLKTLFVERHKTPRDKPCSGIQFPYLEKMMGEKIPKERLCNTVLDRVQMYMPDGKSLGAPFPMINFMRKPFDDWLNIVAQEAGAEFRDECIVKDFEEKEKHVNVHIKPKEGEMERYKTKYLIDSSGMRSRIRNKLRPQDYKGKSSGATLNYYIDGESDLNPNTLYQFWNLDFNNAMFAWIYTKTLDDGKDYWVVGTGYNDGNIKERQTMFYEHVKEKFNINGNIVKKEGFSSSMDIYSEDRVWLGQNRILLTGDAAGLIDQVRGVGMDAAVLSGRLAAKAIIKAERKNKQVLDIYTQLMKRITKQTIGNQQREIIVHATNEDFQKYLEKSMIKTGLLMLIHRFLNKFRPAERQKLLPP